MYVKILYFLLGLISTCSLIKVGPFQALMLMLCLVIIDLIISKTYVRNTECKITKLYLLWSVIGIISSIFGILLFTLISYTPYVDAVLDYLSKILIYFLLFFLFVKKQNDKKYNPLLKGLLWGIIFNCVLAIVDSIVFYATGESITRSLLVDSSGDVFSRSLHLNDGAYRSTALTTDPATVAMYAVILCAYGWYKKKYIYIVISFLCALAALSATLLVGNIIVTLLHLGSAKKTLQTILAGSVIVLIILSVNINSIQTMKNYMFDRMTEKAETGDGIRGLYWSKFPDAVFNSPTSLLIGTGYGTASYAYSKVMRTHYNGKIPYDPEQTYFSYFFDIGLVGVIIWLMIYYRLYYYIRRQNHQNECYDNDALILASVEGFLAVCLFYHYTLFSVQMLFMICGVARVVKIIHNKGNSTRR